MKIYYNSFSDTLYFQHKTGYVEYWTKFELRESYYSRSEVDFDSNHDYELIWESN
jgi:hypothetical protein